MKWIDAFLCFRQQRVAVNGVKSDWAPVGRCPGVFHFKSLIIVTPKYLMLSTFSRAVPSSVYEAWILLCFFVSCIMLHLTG